MRTKEPIAELVGKVISGVVVTCNKESCPRSQVIFTFTDGTAYELWGDEEAISLAGGLDSQGVNQVLEIIKKRSGTEFQVYRPLHEDPNAKQRDLLVDRVDQGLMGGKD